MVNLSSKRNSSRPYFFFFLALLQPLLAKAPPSKVGVQMLRQNQSRHAGVEGEGMDRQDLGNNCFEQVHGREGRLTHAVVE